MIGICNADDVLTECDTMAKVAVVFAEGSNDYYAQASIVNALRELAYAAYNLKREQSGTM